jgi:hypothetical protein
MFAMAFLAGRGQIIPGRKLPAVYAPAVNGSLPFMTGPAFYHGETELVGQLCVTLDATDTLDAMNGPCSETAVYFNRTRPSLLHHCRILFGTMAAKADFFSGFPLNPRILLLFWILGEELLDRNCIKQGKGA